MKREANESHFSYRRRLRSAKLVLKQKRRGVVIWESLHRGTFRRDGKPVLKPRAVR